MPFNVFIVKETLTYDGATEFYQVKIKDNDGSIMTIWDFDWSEGQEQVNSFVETMEDLLKFVGVG